MQSRIAIFVLLAAFVGCVVSLDPCIHDQCKIDDECMCASRSPPIEDPIPQFVLLTFDDAINHITYEQYYTPLFEGRENPDGSPVTATFYVPHEYSDYSKINALYNSGHEIGCNSISKGTADYFATASLETLTEEFDGNRQIISTFANIPIEHIRGARTPHFQLSEHTFDAYTAAGLRFDGSWTSLSGAKWFPYTLDFKSEQQCLIGKCPEKSYPKFWISPINNMKGKENNECNVLHACNVNGTAEEITDWMLEQFEFSKESQVPFKLLINSAWFQLYENSFEALKEFMNKIGKMENVFAVSEWQLIEWMKNPEPWSEDFKVPQEDHNAACRTISCVLKKGEEDRHMTACVDCPNVFPWVGNPLGN